jgi:hypothetical protein
MVARKLVVLAGHLGDLHDPADLAGQLGAGEVFEEGERHVAACGNSCPSGQ